MFLFEEHSISSPPLFFAFSGVTVSTTAFSGMGDFVVCVFFLGGTFGMLDGDPPSPRSAGKEGAVFMDELRVEDRPIVTSSWIAFCLSFDQKSELW